MTAASSTLRAGFVGLGDIGGPMARRIIEAGIPTTLWARRDASLEPFNEAAFTRAATLVELGTACDVVGVCVFSDDDVAEVLTGEAGILAGMAPGGIVLIHSTVSAATCVRMAEEGRKRGVAVLDAPVTGSREGAIAGTLTVMLGGDEQAVARAMPVLRSFGGLIRLLGPVGSGQAMKSLNNVTAFCNGLIATTAIETGQKLGLDPDAVMAVLRAGGGGSRILDVILDKLIPNPAYRAHSRNMVTKDTGVLRTLIEEAGLPDSLLLSLADAYADHQVPELS